MTDRNIKRIFVYSHNSIGLGHSYRTLAVITGIRYWRPDIDFLVVSGTSIPEIFFKEGIEVMKLPSIKLDIDHDRYRLQSRYLSGFDVETIFDFRQRIIVESFDFFKPDSLIIEHNMTGQMSEMIPVLMRKWMRRGGPSDFPLVHICRGIMSWTPLLRIPYQNPRHRSESINIGALYDFMYVLEDRNIIDINRMFLGNDPELEPKIRYFGKITNKVPEELESREETLLRFGLQDRKTILVSLGRKREVLGVCLTLLEAFGRTGLLEDYQVVVVLDPYLDRTASGLLRSHDLGRKVRFVSFVPDLVDLINQAELVVSRAGYNTVNEILLTGAKAILIPEPHGGGEQELRAKTACSERIRVITEDEFFDADLGQMILEVLAVSRKAASCRFDKYAIGKAIIDDIENWRPNRAAYTEEGCNEAY